MVIPWFKELREAWNTYFQLKIWVVKPLSSLVESKYNEDNPHLNSSFIEILHQSHVHIMHITLLSHKSSTVTSTSIAGAN